MVILMDKIYYQELVNKYMPKVPKIKKGLKAFLCGGLIGASSELLARLLQIIFKMSLSNSYLWVGIILVLVTAILTGLGIFDNLVKTYEAGLIIPTTGFSHSVISGSMDGHKEGVIIGIAPSMFKLCASVIVSGVVASFILSIIGWFIYA